MRLCKTQPQIKLEKIMKKLNQVLALTGLAAVLGSPTASSGAGPVFF